MDSGLQLSILEPVAVEYCNQTVNKLMIFVITLAYHHHRSYCIPLIKECNNDDDDADGEALKLQVEEGDTLYVDYEGTLEVAFVILNSLTTALKLPSR